jgi:putative ABC transport system permease protein
MTILCIYNSRSLIILIRWLSFIVGKLANFVIKEEFKKTSLQLFEFDMYQIIVIIVLSGILGVVASFIPAFRASKMNPVEALKYE